MILYTLIPLLTENTLLGVKTRTGSPLDTSRFEPWTSQHTEQQGLCTKDHVTTPLFVTSRQKEVLYMASTQCVSSGWIHGMKRLRAKLLENNVWKGNKTWRRSHDMRCNVTVELRSMAVSINSTIGLNLRAAVIQNERNPGELNSSSWSACTTCNTRSDMVMMFDPSAECFSHHVS